MKMNDKNKPPEDKIRRIKQRIFEEYEEAWNKLSEL